MAILLTTYDPREVYISWDGVELNHGFAPNTFLNVRPDASTFKTYSGIGGTVARTINSIQTATITIKLLQNSDANKQLMTKLNDSVIVNDKKGVIYGLSKDGYSFIKDVNKNNIIMPHQKTATINLKYLKFINHNNNWLFKSK